MSICITNICSQISIHNLGCRAYYKISLVTVFWRICGKTCLPIIPGVNQDLVLNVLSLKIPCSEVIPCVHSGP